MSKLRALLLAPLLLLTGCYEDCDDWDDNGHSHEPSPVSIEIEVYDPVTQFVWEGVFVRIVEADQEWSGLTHVAQDPITLVTNSIGRVFFDEYTIGDAGVGFDEDEVGRAVLWPDFDEDEARVVFEVSAPGFTPVTVVVPVSWDIPDVFIAVPFN